MKIPYHDLLSYISIGDVVSFKQVEQLQADLSFRKTFNHSGYSVYGSTDTLKNGATQAVPTLNEVWTHLPTRERVYVQSNYTASPGERFIILDGREVSYARAEARFDLFNKPEATPDEQTTMTPVRTYVFDLQKVDAPHVVLKRVICNALNFEIKYGNIRILAEVGK